MRGTGIEPVPTGYFKYPHDITLETNSSSIKLTALGNLSKKEF